MNASTSRINPCALRTVLSFAIVSMLSAGFTATAQAQATPQNKVSKTQSYDIAPSGLQSALNNWAKTSGETISYDNALVTGKSSAGARGALSASSALEQILQGTGLQAERTARGTVIRAAVNPTLGAVVVQGTVDTSSLPEEFAGGQVARGANIGVLGNRDMFDTPLSIKSITETSIRNQIAFDSNEILQRDASFVTTNAATINGATAGRLRGFRLEPFESSYDGFSTITSRRYPSEILERVEVLKGPTTIFTSVLGGVGGTVNYVSKKPLNDELNRFTGLLAGLGQAGFSADISRRFGADQSQGLRINLAVREGETAIEDIDESNRIAHLAWNWRSTASNLDVQYGNLDHTLEGGTGGYFLPAGVAVPVAPKGSRISGGDWDTREDRTEFFRAKLEHDFSDSLKGFAVLGLVNENERYVGASITLNDTQGNGTESVFAQEGRSQWGDNYNIDLGLNKTLELGSTTHRFTVALNDQWRENEFSDIGISATYTPKNVNIYNPDSYDGPAPEVTGTGTFFKFNEVRTQGLILSDEIGLLDEQLLVTVGVRHTRFDVTNFNYAAPTPAGTERKYKADDWSPAVGVLYKLSGQTSVYGNYQSAVEQGAVAPITSANAGQVIPPGVAEGMELGIKHEAVNYGWTAALFDIERPSLFTDPVTLIFGEAGLAQHTGLELDVFGEPAKGLRTYASFTYLDAQLKSALDPASVGKTPVSVPEQVLVLGADMDVSGYDGLAVLANVRHVGKQFYDTTNTRSIPAFTVLDLGARYRFQQGSTQWEARLALGNVFNKDYFQSTDFTLQPGAPRTLRATLQAEF